MSAPVVESSQVQLHGRVVVRSAVCGLEDEMFGLLAGHFSGVSRRVFDADLAEKDVVILLEDDEGALRGFSTMCVYEAGSSGRPVTVVYSGDTIVDRSCWGSLALARTWIRTVRGIASGAGRVVFWLLLTSGYRTYRFLPVFFRTFHPRFDRQTPLEERALLHALARERFGARYDAEAGIVRFDAPQVLAGDLLDVPRGRRTDPHVEFFLERNPGFLSGDELVCLTRVDDDNLTPAGRRMAGLSRD